MGLFIIKYFKLLFQNEEYTITYEFSADGVVGFIFFYPELLKLPTDCFTFDLEELFYPAELFFYPHDINEIDNDNNPNVKNSFLFILLLI